MKLIFAPKDVPMILLFWSHFSYQVRTVVGTCDVRVRSSVASVVRKAKGGFFFFLLAHHSFLNSTLAISSSSNIRIPRGGNRGGGRPSKGLEGYQNAVLH